MTLVKICGITSVEDAVEAVRLGANMLGFVFAESPRRVNISTAKSIERIVGADVRTVGVFAEETDEVLRAMDECSLTYAQLHGGQSEEFACTIGAQRVIRAVRVRRAEDIAMLAEHTHAAFYLLDAYSEKRMGGTGEQFDWSLAAGSSSLGRPVILAGGLNPGNVAEAIRTTAPFAVDVSSGVESSPGKKDINKMREFIDNVRKADSGS